MTLQMSNLFTTENWFFYERCCLFLIWTCSLQLQKCNSWKIQRHYGLQQKNTSCYLYLQGWSSFVLYKHKWLCKSRSKLNCVKLIAGKIISNWQVSVPEEGNASSPVNFNLSFGWNIQGNFPGQSGWNFKIYLALNCWQVECWFKNAAKVFGVYGFSRC